MFKIGVQKSYKLFKHLSELNTNKISIVIFAWNIFLSVYIKNFKFRQLIDYTLIL